MRDQCAINARSMRGFKYYVIAPDRACAVGSRSAVIDHPPWQHIKIYNLTLNLRAINSSSSNSNQHMFANALLNLGEGKLIPNDQGLISIPVELGLCTNNKTTFIDQIYPNITSNFLSIDWLSERAILTPHNSSVDAFNEQLLEYLPGENIVLL